MSSPGPNKLSENSGLKPSLLGSSKLSFDNIKSSASIFKKYEVADEPEFNDTIKTAEEVPKPLPQPPARKFVFGQSLFKTRHEKIVVEEKKDGVCLEYKNESKPIFGETCIPEISKELGIDNPGVSASNFLKSFADKKEKLKSKNENEENSSDENKIYKADFEKIDTSSYKLNDNSKTTLEPVEIKTGEEDESKIFSMLFTKIFQFDRVSKSWNEKGGGELRINKSNKDDGKTVARIITRIGANRRVIINSPPFEGMYCEVVTKTRVKFTAQTPDSSIPGLFLINATASNISSFCTCMEKEFSVNVIYPCDESSSNERKRPADGDVDSDNTAKNKKSL
uniref:RanBD1 domain-containing protein n=1 Tax=Strongyloides papillosus TaxID=174720 RepID=A0A0N5BP13_STREA